jgi:tetratricopeptide (TPR) repeat protein
MATIDGVCERLATEGVTVAAQWQNEGKWSEALTLVAGLIALIGTISKDASAKLYLVKAQILRDQGMFGGVANDVEREAAVTQALEYAEQTEDKALLGEVWDTWGRSLHATFLAGDRTTEPPQEMEAFERALAFRQEANDHHGIAESTFHIGIVHQVVRGDSELALPYFRDSYERALALQDDLLASYAIRHIGFARAGNGNMAGARADFEESLRLRQVVGFIPGIAMAQLALGQYLAEIGESDSALPYLFSARDTFAMLQSQRWLQVVEREIALIQSLSSLPE